MTRSKVGEERDAETEHEVGSSESYSALMFELNLL